MSLAEIGMDVDKPHQLEILRADLARIEDHFFEFSKIS